MKKLIIKLLIIFGITISPFVGIFTYGACRKDVYSNTYYGEMKDKIDLLKNTKDPKIVVIGGSSVAFGLRSDELEKATNYKVVNFGLYAGLGTKPMMDLSKKYINKNDIVILAPEIEQQTYSTFYNYNMLHKCLESCYEQTFNLPYKEHLNMFYNYFSYFFEREKVKGLQLEHPYMKECFNSYGDIECEEATQNQFIDLYDNTQLIEPSVDLLDKDFIKCVNQYVKDIRRKKANVYFTFSPSNTYSLITTHIEEFESQLKTSLNCEILGTVNDFAYNPLYFYDTNYHLNYNGSFMHTKKLASFINEVNNYDSNYAIPSKDTPEPKYSITEESMKNGLALQLIDNKYYINGVSDEIKNTATYLDIPSTIDNINIVGINDCAFADCTKLITIKLPQTINKIEGAPFTNCPNLTSIYLYSSSVPKVPAVGLVDGANSNVKIYIPQSLYATYNNGYSWVSYKDKLTIIKEI